MARQPIKPIPAGKNQMNSLRSPKINSRPLYLQAIDAIKIWMEQKGCRSGDMLPAENNLAHELGVSRLTLREAMGYLENDGFIERRRGVGTFVREPASRQFTGGLERLETLRSLANIAGLDLKTVSRQVTVVAATVGWATGLRVSPATQLARVQVTQAIKSATTAYFDSLTPLSVVDLDALR
jgi:GntR family transcriptional regulator